MSKVTKIHTDKTIELLKVCEALAEHDAYQIHVKYYDETIIQYFMHGVSTRMNEVSKEEYGYDVRITSIACEQDFELYRDTVKYMMLLTGGKAIYESDDEIIDANDYFNDDFISSAVTQEFEMSMLLAGEKKGLGFFCPLRPFFVGEKMYHKIKNISDDVSEQRYYLYDLIRKSQYEVEGNDSIILGIRIDPDNNDEENPERVSCYKKNECKFILHAQYFALLDADSGDSIVINYDDIFHVVPETWVLYDESQYITSYLSDEEWTQMWSKALNYKIE